MRKLVESNIYVFKENIKILLNAIVEQFWTKNILQGNLDNMIIRELNKSRVEEIQEMEGENGNTNSFSYSATYSVRLLGGQKCYSIK